MAEDFRRLINEETMTNVDIDCQFARVFRSLKLFSLPVHVGLQSGNAIRLTFIVTLVSPCETLIAVDDLELFPVVLTFQS